MVQHVAQAGALVPVGHVGVLDEPGLQPRGGVSASRALPAGVDPPAPSAAVQEVQEARVAAVRAARREPGMAEAAVAVSAPAHSRRRVAGQLQAGFPFQQGHSKQVQVVALDSL